MITDSNPFVAYLNRYTTTTPDHEAAFDEFIAHTPPPSGHHLRFDTRIEGYLRNHFSQASPPSVILTGNAGDGKTYLCRQIIGTFTGSPIIEWTSEPAITIEGNALRLDVVKDLSELGDSQGAQILGRLAKSLNQRDQADCYLMAANEGRLRALLAHPELRDLHGRIDQQLREGPNFDRTDVIVINLTDVTTSAFVPQSLGWMTTASNWAACDTCTARNRCPIRFNAQQLRDTHIVSRVKHLYELLEHLNIHVTIRDMLIHLTYTVTGGQRCDQVIAMSNRQEDLSWFVYYENIWGREDDTVFRDKAAVVQHLRRLKVGDHSLFEIDDFIISGNERQGEDKTAYQRLFANGIDLDHRRFAQDRSAYIHGSSAQHNSDVEPRLLHWLPHCRRKLFFEWDNVQQVDRLIPFFFVESYLQLLASERNALSRARQDLLVGLNRAFSRLYLTDTNHLYVTSQYLNTTEQPRPLVRVKFPVEALALEPISRSVEAYDSNHIDLWLIIAPPPQPMLSTEQKPVEPLRWRVNLLHYEYLMRLAAGGTYDILAEECELSIRRLKDELISRFARVNDEEEKLEFFVADRRRYVLRSVWVHDGKIEQG